MSGIDFEVLRLLKEISSCLERIDDKLTEVSMHCADIGVAAGDMNGEGIYSISDVVDKLDSIETAIDVMSEKIEDRYV